MKTATSLLGGIGCGAALMYLFDPRGGRRRRAQARDKARRFVHQSEDAVARAGRDAGNRARGLASEARSRLGHEVVSDDILTARVKARIGHYSSRHGGIDVASREGVVTLRGRVPAAEVPAIVRASASVKGVIHVENRLEEDSNAVNSRNNEPRFVYLRRQWSPSARMFAALAGGALIGTALRLRDLRGLASGTLGAGLFTRAVANKELGQLLGYSGGPDAVTVRKTINIDAPVERVFEFWANFENFPRFMTHLREVRDLGNGRSHWIASGPAGTIAEWFAQITSTEPNRLLAWKTVPGSSLEMAGRTRFDPNPDGTTRVDVQLSYCPPAGALGHAIASLFGADPKHAMHEDLARMKSLLERGKTSAHGQPVTKEKLEGVARTLVPGQAAAE